LVAAVQRHILSSLTTSTGTTSQEIHHLSQTAKTHNRFHNNQPPVAILSQINSIHTLNRYFSKIHFNINLPCRPKSSEQSSPFRLTFRIMLVFTCGPNGMLKDYPLSAVGDCLVNIFTATFHL
jgi:hypothetical protein